MCAMDARRLELYELLKPKLEEEPARALVLALPADPDRLATKDDIAGIGDDMAGIVLSLGQRMDRIQEGMDRMEERLIERMDHIQESLVERMDARLAQQDATLTRRMVTIMGAWTILTGSTIGWVAVLLR